MEPDRFGALDYIYIAQRVRSQGVLLQDCRNHEAEIEDLEREGLVERIRWYRHSTLRVSESGKKREAARLRERVESNADILKRALDYIPPRIAHFLVNESVLRLPEDELSYPVNLQEISPYSDVYSGTFNCVITRWLLNELSEILFGLERASCATRATYYVSSRGGETREERVVLSPEAVRFLKEYSENLNQRKLSSDLRQAHSLYHGLHDYKLTHDWFMKQKGLMNVEPKTWRENVSFLVRQGLLAEARDELVVNDRGKFEEILEQLYLRPIQLFLEGSKSSVAEDFPDDLNKRLESVGQRLGKTIDDALRKRETEWISRWVDPDTRKRVQKRLDEKVAEDPRTELYQFFTLGELKDLVGKEEIWTAISSTFVNQPGMKPSPVKFHSNELFFGCLDLVIAYRNPASHGVYLRPDATNVEIIGATLTKLENILFAVREGARQAGTYEVRRSADPNRL